MSDVHPATPLGPPPASGPARLEAATPGQAAYEAWNGGARNADWSAIYWREVPGEHERWEAAAAAAVRAGLPLVLAQAARYKAERDDWREAADGWEGNFRAARKDADRYRAALDNLRPVLREHYLAQVACDPERKQDNPVCQCSRVHLGWHPSIGAAVEAWIDHVLAIARQDADFDARLAVLDSVTAERDRYRAALERVLRILRGEGTEAMDDAELAAVIARALSEDDELVTTVARGLGYEVTHLVTVPRAALEPMAWPSPKYPFAGIRAPVVAACGTRVRSCQPVLVVMVPGSRVTCRHCARITGIERQSLTIQPQRQESP